MNNSNIFPVGSIVEIIKEPSHYNPFMYPDAPIGETGGMIDLKHLIGLQCEVEDFYRLPIGNLEENERNGIGYYHLKIPKTKEGVPIGLLTVGFPNNILKLIK